MAYTNPRTWVVGEVLTAALLNTHLRDNLNAIATSAGLLLHEAGGIEANISAVVLGGLVVGTGTGIMGLKAVGSNSQMLMADSAQAGGIKWNPAWVLEGKDTTERTTTSLTLVDLSTLTGLSIPTTTPVFIIVQFRKTTGAASYGSLALKVNSTVVRSSVQVTSATNQAENGILEVILLPQEANYLRGGTFRPISTGDSTFAGGIILDVDMPNATITSITIQGKVGDALITLATKNMFVYSLPT